MKRYYCELILILLDPLNQSLSYHNTTLLHYETNKKHNYYISI